MFNFIYDYKIRKQCKKSHVILSEEFKRRTDTLLSHLPKENGIYKENKRRMVVLPALIAVLLISIPAAAAVNYYQQRMEAMSQQKIDGYYEDLAESKANGDSFSRSFTETESARKQVLEKEYETEGKFPEKELLQVSSEEERTKDQLCFVTETSTFYLPDRELSEEELLELIDFYHKRDYALSEINQDTKEQGSQQNTGFSKEEAMKKAEEWVYKIYMEDVTAYENNVVILEHENHQVGVYEIEFENTKDQITYKVMISNDNENFDAIWRKRKNCSQSDGSVLVDKKRYQAEYNNIKRFLTERIDSGNTVKAAVCQYSVQDENNLVRGSVSYQFQMSDGSGYWIRYYPETDEIYNISYAHDYRVFWDGEENDAKKMPDGVIRERIVMEE